MNILFVDGRRHARLAPLVASLATACSAPRAAAPAPPPSAERHDAAAVVAAFFAEVRSGRAPERATELLAPRVLAHQVNAEDEQTIARTPADYAAHVREMLATNGPFRLEITEMLSQGDRVYVRWRQTGAHRQVIDGWAPTGLPLVEVASAVYRVEGGKIAEYWIQIDREGLRLQLERNAKSAPPSR